MPSALICSQADLSGELGQTLLWRHDFERHVAARLEEARMMAVAARPDVILVDRDLPRADQLVAQLRTDAATRHSSLVIVARGDFLAGEIGLLEAGANAILRLPAGPEWDERLTRLLAVPVRREARIPVQFAVDASVGPGPPIPALALNLSTRGMLMESSVPVVVGDEIALVLRLPDAAVMGTGRVARQAASTQFGIEFLTLSADGVERVRQYVAGLAAR